MRKLRISLVTMLLLLLGLVSVQAGSTTNAKVTYVASEGIYLEAGTDQGVKVGDTLAVMRYGVQIASVAITNVASRSSVGSVVAQSESIRVGDIIRIELIDPDSPEVEPESTLTDSKTEERYERQESRLTGTVALGQQWSQDMTSSGLSHFQPYLRTRLTLKDVFAEGVNLSLRHRVRLSHRSRAIGDRDRNNWSNQLFELSLSTGTRQDLAYSRWGFGRVMVSEVRGMGYLDGAYYIKPVADRFKIGIALGAVPDLQTSDVDLDRKKIGFIGEYRSSESGRSKLRAAISLSGEYQKTTLSREYIYLQTVYSPKSSITWIQSAEIDYNRSWRYDRSGRRFDISNYYTTLNLGLSSRSSIDLSWDSRTNLLTYDNRSLEDSLFDDSNRQGLRIGLRTRPTSRLSLSASGSIRFRDGLPENNRSFSFSARIQQFPARRHSLTLRLSTTKTEFTTAYRPQLMLRLPVSRKIYLNSSITSLIYEQSGNKTNNYYLDFNTAFLIGRRYSFYGGMRQYFDDELKSLDLYTELGIAIGN